MKPIEVKRSDLYRLGRQLKRSTRQSLQLLSCLLADHTRGDPIEVLSLFKFSELGFDPLVHGRRLNFIEQVNQAFTVSASLKAASHFFATSDAHVIRMNIGAHKGFDLEVYDDASNAIGVAEVFAAVDPRNNQKLRRDVERVRSSILPLRRVYFLSPSDKEFGFENSVSKGGELTLPDGFFIKRLKNLT